MSTSSQEQQSAASIREIQRFLLGQLSDRRRSRLEARLLADDRLFEEVLAQESELLDAFARNELSRRRHRLLERRIRGSKRLQDRLDAARALAVAADRAVPASSPKPLVPRFWLASPLRVAAFAAAALLILALSIFRPWQESSTAPVELQAGEEAPRPVVISETSYREGLRRSTATFDLPPQILRSGEDVPTLRLPAGANVVTLRLGVDPGAELSTVEARLEGRGPGVLWGGLKAPDPSLGGTVDVPVEVPFLRPGGRYTVTLSGSAATGEPRLVGSYVFVVLPEETP